MAINVAGATTGTGQEVDSNTRAARVTLRNVDVGTLGSYRKALQSGTVAAGLSGPLPVFSFQFKSAVTTQVCVLRRVIISCGNTATAFTAGLFTIQMFVNRGFTTNYSTNIGTTGTLTTNNAKLRTSYGTSVNTGTIIILGTSASGLTTASVKTQDTDPCGIVSVGVPAVAGSTIIPPTAIYDQATGAAPLVFAGTGDGFELDATVPATGTWNIGVVVEWDELASYTG